MAKLNAQAFDVILCSGNAARSASLYAGGEQRNTPRPDAPGLDSPVFANAFREEAGALAWGKADEDVPGGLDRASGVGVENSPNSLRARRCDLNLLHGVLR